MKKLLLASLFAAAAFTLSASSPMEIASAQAQAYGPAGCGLGAMLIGNKPGFVQVFAATTNGIFGNQTFGISSGTLGCGAQPTVTVSSTKQYIQSNRQAFAKDVARGQGETVANLASLAGCSNSAEVGVKLQASYKTIFPAANVSDVQVSENAVAVLRADASLACSKLI